MVFRFVDNMCAFFEIFMLDYTKYHLVWIPRYLRKIFAKVAKEYTEKIILHIPELCPDIELVKLNVQGDHCSRGSRDASQNCSCRCNSVYQIQLAKKAQGEVSFYAETMLYK